MWLRLAFLPRLQIFLLIDKVLLPIIVTCEKGQNYKNFWLKKEIDICNHFICLCVDCFAKTTFIFCNLFICLCVDYFAKTTFIFWCSSFSSKTLPHAYRCPSLDIGICKFSRCYCRNVDFGFSSLAWTKSMHFSPLFHYWSSFLHCRITSLNGCFYCLVPYVSCHDMSSWKMWLSYSKKNIWNESSKVWSYKLESCKEAHYNL